MKNKIYKIRRKDDGLFAPGGFRYSPIRWNKEGKTWNSLGALHSHLSGQNEKVMREYAREAEIVEYEVVITELKSWSMAEDISERQKKKEEKRRKIRERDQKLKEDFEKRKLRELMDKYGTDV